MQHEVVQQTEADGEQQKIGEQRVDDEWRGVWFRRTKERDTRSYQPDHQKGEGEIAKNEVNRACDQANLHTSRKLIIWPLSSASPISSFEPR